MLGNSLNAISERCIEIFPAQRLKDVGSYFPTCFCPMCSRSTTSQLDVKKVSSDNRAHKCNEVLTK